MSSQPGIEKLRESLFETLDGLRNKTMDIATAKAMSEISQTIINSAKVEIEFQQQHKRLVESEFFKMPNPLAIIGTPKSVGAPKTIETPKAIEEQKDGVTKTKHGYIEEAGNSKIHRMT